jgi:hypothetical protein
MGFATRVVRRAANAESCARWVEQIYAARADWTPNFDGVQFTLGRAWYTHLEEDAAGAYFAGAAGSDALVRARVPGLQEALLTLAAQLVGAPVQPRAGWCGPGVHIFPAGEWLAQHGGDVHFDTEGLRAAELAARAPALSLILMLQPPEQGGGLAVWSARYQGEDHVDEPERFARVDVDYGVGDLVAIDSYRLHQIQPFAGARDRISATTHLVQHDGAWHAWF